MEKQKIIEVYITALRITAEDKWLKDYIEGRDGVKNSPHYLYLQGSPMPLVWWMEFRKLPVSYIARDLMKVFFDIVKNGQREPILIYEDMRINSGHKRAAVMLALGYNKIKAVVVPDDFKL